MNNQAIFSIPMACAVCFGDPGSSLSKGVIAAVLFMIGVVGVVLAAIASTALVWTRRK